MYVCIYITRSSHGGLYFTKVIVPRTTLLNNMYTTDNAREYSYIFLCRLWYGQPYPKLFPDYNVNTYFLLIKNMGSIHLKLTILCGASISSIIVIEFLHILNTMKFVIVIVIIVLRTHTSPS